MNEAVLMIAALAINYLAIKGLSKIFKIVEKKLENEE